MTFSGRSVLFLCAVGALTPWVRADCSSVGDETKSNLSLPLDATLEVAEDDAAIALWGTTEEGGGLVFVVDAGHSTVTVDELSRAKRELGDVVAELGPHTEVALVFYGAGVHRFPPTGPPVPTTAPNRAALAAWLRSLSVRGGSSQREAIALATELARALRTARRLVVRLDLDQSPRVVSAGFRRPRPVP